MPSVGLTTVYSVSLYLKRRTFKATGKRGYIWLIIFSNSHVIVF